MQSKGESASKKKGKRKGEAEVQNFICGINNDGGSRSGRGRYYKATPR